MCNSERAVERRQGLDSRAKLNELLEIKDRLQAEYRVAKGNRSYIRRLISTMDEVLRTAFPNIRVATKSAITSIEIHPTLPEHICLAVNLTWDLPWLTIHTVVIHRELLAAPGDLYFEIKDELKTWLWLADMERQSVLNRYKEMML